MRPEDPSKSSKPQNSRDLSVPNRDAAANLVRGQIDALYGDRGATDQPTTKSAPADVTKADSTATDTTTTDSSKDDPWQNYHNQWQKYYQEYYQRYYTGHMHQILSEQEQKHADELKQTLAPTNEERAAATPEAVDELKQKILTNVQTSAKKVRKSRHFIPISAAVIVVLVFGFLQYNSVLIGTVQAYVSPGAIDPQNIVVDPTASVAVSQDPRLIIPKINVDVPVIYDVATDHAAQMAAMQKGVAHFAVPGASSVPGQVGNTVFSGHSSNDLFEPGDYKFIFAQLDKLQNGDTIYVNYQGTRYTYTITKQEVVKPTNVQALTYATDKPVLTLITCTPLGTSTNRLLITAEQVSPDPGKAAASPTTNGAGNNDLPGNSASALEKLFGSKG